MKVADTIMGLITVPATVISGTVGVGIYKIKKTFTKDDELGK